MKPDPTQRFSERVESYVKCRPTYPAALIEALRQRCCLDGNSVVADIGSGTGIFTALLLDRGFQVFAVEPNAQMRRAAERRFAGAARFRSVAGTAECSGLADKSVDLVAAAQAFHWFRPAETRAEFQRLLKPNGWVALVWNHRKTATSFQRAYDNLLRQHAPEYESADHRNVGEDVIDRFYGHGGHDRFTFENCQYFALDGLKGRMQSSSYTPTPDQPQHAALMAGLGAVFSAHAIDGQVMFEYETRLYVGKLTQS